LSAGAGRWICSGQAVFYDGEWRALKLTPAAHFSACAGALKVIPENWQKPPGNGEKTSWDCLMILASAVHRVLHTLRRSVSCVARLDRLMARAVTRSAIGRVGTSDVWPRDVRLGLPLSRYGVDRRLVSPRRLNHVTVVAHACPPSFMGWRPISAAYLLHALENIRCDRRQMVACGAICIATAISLDHLVRLVSGMGVFGPDSR